MSIGLLLPLGLLALAGAFVPLLIHLIRRSEQRPIDFPALRWLRESVRPRRRLRFEDPWLLLLRLLLLVLIAVLLAQPVLRGDWRGPHHWIVLHAGIDLAAAQREHPDAQAHWRWLASGFPAASVEAAVPARSQPFASLLREFDAMIPAQDTLSVFVPARLEGLDAERLRLHHAVEWRIAPAAMSVDAALEVPTRRVALRHAVGEESNARYLRAALAAWKAAAGSQWTLDDRAVGSEIDRGTDWVIWLGAQWPAELETWLRGGGRLLHVDATASRGNVVWRDPNGVALARDERFGAGHVIHLLRTPLPGTLPAVLDADFPQRLQALFEGEVEVPNRAFAEAVRPSRLEDAWPTLNTNLSSPLLLAIALTFLAERWIATRRRRPA